MYPVYTLANNGVVVATGVTALQVKAGTKGPIEILRAVASQAGSAVSAMAQIGLVRKTAAATVTGAVVGTTILPHSAIAGTPDAPLSTSATGVTATVEGTDGAALLVEGFNVLSGWRYLPVPEERIIVPVGGIIAMKVYFSPAGLEWACSITFRELRGD